MSQNRWNVVLGTLIFAFSSVIDGLAISYCSPVLNAGGYNGVYSEFMSNGFCQDQCQGSYVFAVLQGNLCWCSNYVPGNQQGTLDCNQACPGFQSEWCGSTQAGLYGYYNLGGVPLGTSGGLAATTPASTIQPVSTTLSTPGSSPLPPPSSPLSLPSVTSTSYFSSAEATSTSETLSTSVVTVVPPQSSVQISTSSAVERSSTAPVPVSSASTSSTTQSSTFISSTTSPTSPPPSSEASTTEAPSSMPSSVPPNTIVTTVLGSVKTILVTPTPSATADPTLGQGATNSAGVSTGKVVGIVLGVALGLGLLIGLGVFFWLRRKHANSIRGLSPDGSSYRETPADSNRIIPSRQVSQMSSSNLLTRGGSVQTKSLNPSSTTRSAETASSGVDRRSLGTDQRLNPHALYIHDEGQFSNLSLQDNQDYSRQLRVANPDP